jgi:hypothetical protein
MRNIRAGRIRQEEAARLEKGSLAAMESFARDQASPESVVAILREYEQLYAPEADHSAQYLRTLQDRPWSDCSCDVCSTIGHHVILFRGAERNRRRGFHNLWTFRRRLHSVLGAEEENQRTARALKYAH